MLSFATVSLNAKPPVPVERSFDRKRSSRNRLSLNRADENLFLRPSVGPYNAILFDPVVRSARESPATDRRPETYRVAVKGELPIGGANRRGDLDSAAAATQVDCDLELHADVQLARFYVLRDVLDELVG